MLVLTQFDDVWHGGVPAALGAGCHGQVIDVTWRQREAGPHHVPSYLTEFKDTHTRQDLLHNGADKGTAGLEAFHASGGLTSTE